MKLRTLKIDISPQAGVDLCGFANRPQPSTHLLDSLFCKILFLGEGEEQIVLVQLDLIGLHGEFSNELRKRLGADLNLGIERIQVFCSHTHSGPCTLELLACGEFDPAYLDFLFNKVVDTLATKYSDCEVHTCSVKWFSGSCDLGVQRRGKRPAKGVDHLGVLAFQSSSGGYPALLINYAMHPVMLRGSGISADYPGELSSELERNIQGEPLVLFGLGAAGDMDPPGVGVDVSQMKKWSAKLAGEVISCMNIDPSRSVKNIGQSDAHDEIIVTRHSIRWPVEFLSAEEIDHQTELYLNDKQSLDLFGPNYQRAVQKWRQNRLIELSSNAANDVEISLDIVQIGQFKMILVNAELFSSIYSTIDTKPLCLISCANGMLGYLPDHEHFQAGGYEVDLAHIFYNSFRIKAGLLEEIAHFISSL
ncbi:MAG: hypothetical protein HOK84_05160 [Bacteroidetes bacterium]|nr:hypothetical protein [Bacteroidota bacterium]